MPVVISFTVETNGKLPTGQTLEDAIAQSVCVYGPISQTEGNYRFRNHPLPRKRWLETFEPLVGVTP